MVEFDSEDEVGERRREMVYLLVKSVSYDEGGEGEGEMVQGRVEDGRGGKGEGG